MKLTKASGRGSRYPLTAAGPSTCRLGDLVVLLVTSANATIEGKFDQRIVFTGLADEQ